jgi:ATP-dependent DNA helicase RecQ
MPSPPDSGTPADNAPGAAATDPVLAALRERFGIAAFRDGQEEVVRAVMAGRPALAVFPTGSGKSLCFQLPALLLDGLTVVVSPLIALMADQVGKLSALGLPAARIDSTLTDDEVEGVFAELAVGGVRLLYVSPERLAAVSFLRRLRHTPVALLAVDEAHCISEWGHNFRPDYLKLARMRRKLGARRVLALTATATPSVARDIRKAFGIARADHFHHPTQRPNLHLGVTACGGADKDATLVRLLRETDGPVIVYATTRRTTEILCAMLQGAGVAARVYHAGCEAEERAAAQCAFLRGETRVMVATIAFGMGIDKPDIRAVIHYNLPKSLEGYCQEIGRAGRDGLPARCELLATLEDTLLLENFIHGATPSDHGLRALLDRILRLAAPGRRFAVSPHSLAVAHDMREETVATALAYLELAGTIERNGSFYDCLRVAAPRSLEPIVSGRARAERKTIATLFAAASPDERGGLLFHLSDLADTTGIRRERIEGILTALAQAGEIRLTRSGIRVVYRTAPKWDGRAEPVISDIARRFAERARQDYERIGTVVDFARSKRCRVTALADYFGQRGVAPCGRCDRCRGEPPAKLRAIPPAPIPDDEWARMRALRDERHPALGTPRSLARFLCGIPSPAATSARLHTHPAFGIWQHHRFQDILALVGE